MLYAVDTASSTKIVPYEHYSKMLAKRNVHCEPVKNLLIEMHFLSEYACKGDTVVYASDTLGASSSSTSHVPHLVDMFKCLELEWYIYDGSAAAGPLHSGNVTGVHVIKDMPMDDAVSVHWKKEGADKNKRVLFLHDMRVNTEEHMDMQKQWVLKMQPHAACLKMKPAFGTDAKEFAYLPGRLFMQPFASPNSAEMRLFYCTTDSSSSAQTSTQCCYYNHKQMEEAAAFFNRFVRPKENFDTVCMESIVNEYCLKMHYPNMPSREQLLMAIKEFMAHSLHTLAATASASRALEHAQNRL